MSDSQNRGQYLEQQRERQLIRQGQSRLEAACEMCHEALAEGDYYLVSAHLSETILPAIQVSTRDLARIESSIDLDRREWHRGALRVLLGADSGDDIESLDTETLANGFRSAYTLLAGRGRIDDDATTVVPAIEYDHQIGERYYSPLSKGSSTAELIDEDDDWKATLLTGGQGSGKSATGFTIGEDRVAAGHKLIDLVDLSKAENVMWDVESRNDDLREIREEMGLEADFVNPVLEGLAWLFDEPAPDGYRPPDIEIRLPMTHELSDSTIPVDTRTGEPVIEPFTIPASDLSYRQLVMLLPHTTKTQENYLHSAHQILKNRDIDWTLADMADAVQDETNAGEAVAARIRRALDTTQQKGFIRDLDADYQLDWDAIMADPDTVTAFSLYMIDEKSDKLALASYLIDSLYEARKRQLREHVLNDYPPLTLMLRELHDIAPRTKAEQESESTFEGYMIDLMGEVLALMRHVNMEIIADTQKFKQQLSPDVSRLFHRVFAFNGQQPDIKRVFRTRVDDTAPAEKVARYDTGKCGLVHDDGYTTPIQMAPPRMHHLDARVDGDGLGARTRYLEHEELRPAPWDSEVPPRLRFDDMPKSPMTDFFYEHIQDTGDERDYIVKMDLTEVYNAWAESNGRTQKGHNRFCRWINEHLELDDGQPRFDGKTKSVWRGIVVTYDCPELEDARVRRSGASRTDGGGTA